MIAYERGKNLDYVDYFLDNKDMTLRLTLADVACEEDFPFYCGKTCLRKPYPEHSHAYTEIVVITAGHGRHCIDHRDYEIGAGDVYVLYGNTVHGFPEVKELELFNVMFKWGAPLLDRDEFLILPGYQALFHWEPNYRQQHAFRSHMKLSPKGLAGLEAMLNRLEHEYRAQTAGYRLLCRALLHELVIELCRAYPGTQQYAEAHEIMRLARVTAYMEEHFTQALKIEQLARMACFSPRHFIRVFARVYGVTPGRYLEQRRVREACRLLSKYPEMSIAEVATNCGYRDSNFFSRQFREFMGMPPREYRRVGIRMEGPIAPFSASRGNPGSSLAGKPKPPGRD